jgi:hypothetical protein
LKSISDLSSRFVLVRFVARFAARCVTQIVADRGSMPDDQAREHNAHSPSRAPARASAVDDRIDGARQHAVDGA